MTIVDSRRKAIAREVVRIAKSSHNEGDLIRTVRKKYRRSKFLGEGIHRDVYSLPFGLVLKVDKDDKHSYDNLEHAGNEAEVATSKVKKLKPYLVPLLAHHLGEKVKVVVSRRAQVPLVQQVYKDDGKYAEQFNELAGMFQDCHASNVGVLNGKLLMIDTGCESYAEAA